MRGEIGADRAGGVEGEAVVAGVGAKVDARESDCGFGGRYANGHTSRASLSMKPNLITICIPHNFEPVANLRVT